MPLAPSGSRGYPPWQRIQNYDSPVLWSSSPVLSTVTVTSPVIDVSRYAYLGGSLDSTHLAFWVDIQWFVDAAATVRVGRQQFLVDVSTAACKLRLPNLGPFCVISCAPAPGPSFSAVINVFGTNRVHPLEFIPETPQLLTWEAQTIPNGQSYVNIPDYYSGPVLIVSLANTTQITVTPQWFDSTRGAHNIDQWISGGGAITRVDTVLPDGFCAILLTNTGAAQTGSLWVTASATGAL